MDSELYGFADQQPFRWDAFLTPPKRAMPAVGLFPGPDPVEFGHRSFKLVVEEPHRIEDFAESCRCLGSVGASICEDAVVSQISHDSRL